MATGHSAVADFTGDFSRDFNRRFGGKRVTKTAYHFFSWAYNYADGDKRDASLAKFKAYCERTKCRATWRNAAEWFATGAVMSKGGAR